MFNKLKNKLLQIIPLTAWIGILLGAIGGYLYYIKIGCASGSCPLTSNPFLTVLWGAVMGYLLGDMFSRKKSTPDSEKQNIANDK